MYTDGTVLVTHGVEMGQGLHTKVAQIAAYAFDIPLSSVFISETSTDKVITDYDVLNITFKCSTLYAFLDCLICRNRFPMHLQLQLRLVLICMGLWFWMRVIK